MITISQLKSEIDTRRRKIVTLLVNFLLFISYTVLGIYLVYFSIPSLRHERISKDVRLYIIFASITLLIAIGTTFLRFYLLKRHLRLTLIILAVVWSIPAYYVLLYTEIDTPVPYMILALIVVTTNIVLGSKYSYRVYLFISAVIALVGYLHLASIFHYTPDSTETTIPAILTYVLLLGIFTYIAKVSYEQIEDSYDQAFGYARKLEALNQELDKKVKKRTQQLRSSLEAQANSIQAAAVIGRITQPLIHDLGTYISSISGAIELLNSDGKNFTPKERKFLNLIESAANQSYQIIASSKELMTNKTKVDRFDPISSILNITNIIQSEVQRNEIEIAYEFKANIILKGTVSLFERIITNILMNAVEELNNVDYAKIITISTEIEGNKFLLSIKDNGRGIPKEKVKKIFESDYSNKSDGHLGIGLVFVKGIMENHFNGTISVDSVEDEYSDFILTFNVPEEH